MNLKENDNLPNSEVFVLEEGEPVKKNIEDLIKNKKVVIFGLPGAYTSVCSAKHLPGYVNMSEKYKEKGSPIIKILSPTLFSLPHACITNGSFTETQII